MTCVAARPRAMVSDTRVSGVTVTKDSKIYRINGYLVGFAGDMGTWQRLAELATWPKRVTRAALVKFADEYIDHLGDDGCDVLVCTRAAVWTIDGSSVTEARVGVIGSGAAVALGYLEARPDDIQGAVKAACKLDPSCGLPIQVVTIPR